MSATNRESEEAYERFVARNYAKLVTTVELLVRNRSTAEDIVQETLARAYLNWPKLWPDGNPNGWAYRVATNFAMSWWRRAGREAKALVKLGDPRKQTAHDQFADLDLADAVAKLPPRQRTAVALFYTLDLPVEEVAATMRCPAGTVRSLLHAARQKLKKELNTEDE